MHKAQLVIDGTSSNIVIFKASTWLERVRGLLWYRPLSERQGLWLEPCSSIHTVFMQYSIDVIFLDKSNTVKKIDYSVKPWRLAFCWCGKSTIELLAGVGTQLKLQVGQKLHYEIATYNSEKW